MTDFATYLYSLPTSPLIEAVKALYEPNGTLRKPTPEELSEFVSMASETEHTMRGDWESNREAIVNEDKEFIEQVSNGTFKAVTDGNGIVIYGPYDGRIYVYLLFVRPECRRTGTAQRLMEYVKTQAKGMPVALSVNNHNDAARALYKKLGMTDSKTFGYDGYDIIEMQSPVMEAVKNLYENMYTDRAVRVNKLLTEFLNDFRVEVEKFIRSKLEEEIQRLIKHRVLNNRNLTDKERDKQINEIRTYEVVSFATITLTCAGMKCILLFNGKNKDYSACCTRDREIYINVYKCIDDATSEYANYDYDALFSGQPVKETENDRIYNNMYDNILKQCEKWNKILVTSQNIDDIIKALVDFSRSASLVDTLRHELTHADQRNHPDQNSYGDDELNYDRYMAKYMPSVDRSDDSYITKYHSIFPWEIDAKIQERITDIVKNDANASITDIAKEIYDWAIYKIKNLGLDTPERRKQCWKTAVSLARAAQYTTKEHGTVSPEWSGHNEDEQQSMSKLINHLGDYPV